MEVAAFCISLTALAFSAFSIYMSYFRMEAERESDLQQQYNEIRSRMDMRYRDEEWAPPKDDQSIWVPFVQYWYFCFHEYEVTAKSPRRVYRRLWENKLRERVKAGLSHRPLRYILYNIIQSGSMSDGYADDFIAEMKKIYGRDFIAEFNSVAKMSAAYRNS